MHGIVQSGFDYKSNTAKFAWAKLPFQITVENRDYH
jgi:hypothetical protein